ncbi:fructosamine kinase family protein [Pelagicoccus albus]|uniref:Fructosamine kinase family protein n=1 Tax=Pelagicoccus albus TaxID=415222 RepID=A0A7X1E930_9BACT|nr:fructosamine kinase family protein [Pelagicoccus albus]MBC2606768.1 fructosamine kinase family protein [Pelagicoccus albus]
MEEDKARIEAAISEQLGTIFQIESQKALGGGCINDAYCLQGDGHRFFLKSNRPDFSSAFSSEAEALNELADTQTVRVPKVLASFESSNKSYLILEYIEPARSGSRDWAKLGRQLAELHKIQKPFFGWKRDNFIGATPQPNPRGENWDEFFKEHRLKRMLTLCQKLGYRIPGADQLLQTLPDFFESYAPQPSLLHGDLWSGNVAFDSDGAPFVFDPASYYGDRETDLAFTEFFGGFSPEFYTAYQDAFPLAAGYEKRKILYNLYHCLNHLYLFGSSYSFQAEQMVRQLLE